MEQREESKDFLTILYFHSREALIQPDADSPEQIRLNRKKKRIQLPVIK